MSKKPEASPPTPEKLSAPWAFMKKSISNYIPEDPVGVASYGTHIFPAFSTKKDIQSSIIAARTEDLASLNIPAKALKQAFSFCEDFCENYHHIGFLQIHRGTVYSDRHSVGFACEEVLASLAQIFIALGTQSLAAAASLGQFPESLSHVAPYLNDDCIGNGFACVFEAIAFLEKSGIAHGYINPATVFVTRTGFRVMPPISAFMPNKPAPAPLAPYLASPAAFTAPEIIFQKKVSQTSDVFSAALTCATCYAPGLLAPQQPTPMTVYSIVLRMLGPTTVNEANYSYYTQSTITNTSLSPNPYAVVSRGIQSDLSQRPKASDLITLAYFNTPNVRLLRDLTRGDLSPAALAIDPKHPDQSHVDVVRRKIQDRLNEPLPSLSRGQYVDVVCPLLIAAVNDPRLCVNAIKWATAMLPSLTIEDTPRSILPIIAPVLVASCNKDLKPQRTPKILKGRSSKHGAVRGTNFTFEADPRALADAVNIIVENLAALLTVTPPEWADTYLVPFICSSLSHNDNYIRASIFPALVTALPHVRNRAQLLHYINIAANEGDMNTKINFVVFLSLSVDNLEIEEIYQYLLKPLSSIVQGIKDERLSPRAATAINNIHSRCGDYDVLARVLIPLLPPLAITPNMSTDDTNLILDILKSLTDSFINKYRGTGTTDDYINRFEEELINKESNKDLAIMAGPESRPEPMAREVILAHTHANPIKHEDWGSSIGDLANINFDFNNGADGTAPVTAPQKYTQQASYSAPSQQSAYQTPQPQTSSYSMDYSTQPQQSYTTAQPQYSAAPQNTYAAPPQNDYNAYGGYNQYSSTTSNYSSPYPAQQNIYSAYSTQQNTYSSYSAQPQQQAAAGTTNNFDIFNF